MLARYTSGCSPLFYEGNSGASKGVRRGAHEILIILLKAC